MESREVDSSTNVQEGLVMETVARVRKRSSGILAPLFSLPGTLDIGTLGRSAETFLNFLQSAKQTWFQTLPITPVDQHGSPYAGSSAFAGEILYLDLEELYEEDLVPNATERSQTSESRKSRTFPLNETNSARVNYKKARRRRKPFWREAYERYREGLGGERYRQEEEEFRAKNDFWLDDYALFEAAAETFKTRDWSQWPTEIRRRDPSALEAFAKDHAEQIDQTRFLQLVFDVQWRVFRQECAKREIKILGDLPIYVGIESADVWAAPELFMATRDGRVVREGGTSPDDYNSKGQRWGTPTYRWSRHIETDFSWWKNRVKKTLERFDALRLDHFIGFYNYYSFPSRTPDPGDAALWAEEQAAAARYAIHAEDSYEKDWTPGPQERFFDAIFTVVPRGAFVAEDLGNMNQGVAALRDRYKIPGMRVFQFSFDSVELDGRGGAPANPLREWPEKSVGCTGTHDAPPVLGWLDDVRRFGGKKWKTLDYSKVDFKAIKEVLRRYRSRRDPPAPQRFSRPIRTLLSRFADAIRLTSPKSKVVSWSPDLPESVAKLHAAALRAVSDSPCRLVIFPIQDALGLSNDSRINAPGKSKGSWTWRLHPNMLSSEDAEFVAHVAEETGRAPSRVRTKGQNRRAPKKEDLESAALFEEYYEEDDNSSVEDGESKA